MSLNGRLKRLEAALGAARPYLSVWDLLFLGKPIPDGFDPARDLHPQHLAVWNAFVTLPAENGSADAPEALGTGEAGPEGTGNLLREQVRNDDQQRASKMPWQQAG